VQLVQLLQHLREHLQAASSVDLQVVAFLLEVAQPFLVELPQAYLGHCLATANQSPLQAYLVAA
jgi:hypothetical protein